MVKITVGEFIRNIRKNGLPKTRRNLFQNTDGHKYNSLPFNKIHAACAFGQGLINSKAYFNPAINEDLFLRSFYDSVWGLNDEFLPNYTLEQIADILEEKYSTQLNRVLTFESFDYTPYLEGVTA